MKNADMPANPTLTYDHNAAMNGIGVSVTESVGLAKREMFAMAAMQGLLSRTGTPHRDIIAGYAVEYADALLKELDK